MSTNPSDMVRSGAPMVERLPYEPEAERAVLGAVLLDPNALLVVMEKLREDEFYIEAHRLIYSTCLALHERGQAADLLTVTNHLREQGQLERVGGPAYLSSMVDALPDVANVSHYGGIVHDKSVKRRLIVAAQKILTTCSMDHGEAREAVESAQRDVYHIAEDTLAGGLQHIRGLAEAELQNIEDSRSTGSALTGLDTGFVRTQRVHLRIPEKGPRHPRRPSLHGEDITRGQHLHPRRPPSRQEGRDLLPRDVLGTARPPHALGRGPSRPEAAFRRLSRQIGLAQTRDGGAGAPGGQHLGRRLPRHHRARTLGQGAPAQDRSPVSIW